MGKERIAIGNEDFVFTETEEPNVYLFYRNDGSSVIGMEDIAMDMYQSYICIKIFEENSDDIVASNIKMELSDNNKSMKVTSMQIDQKGKYMSKVKSLFKKRRG